MIDAHRRHRKAQRRNLDREQPLVAPRLADQSSDELVAQLFDQELTPASAAIQQEMRRRLEAAIASLEEQDREIILMKLQESLPNHQVAAILGLSEAAASMRYLRAVRRLRAILLTDRNS
jgi:RNA polymerase sigma-70 factor (ECF subfamily)